MATHDAEALASMYSVREVSAMLDLTPRQIRAFVTDGAVVPVRGERGRFLFSFQDLVVLRAAADLIGEGVASQRVHAAIRGLRDQMPARTSLAGAKLEQSGRTVVVRLDAEVWEPESGQTVFDFDVAGVAQRAKEVADARAYRSPEAGSASAWYGFADEIEQSDPAAAEDAYRTAIELDPSFADAHLNLGRLLHSAGAVRDALDEYRVAHELDHEDATTLYNIGVASQDLGDITEAMTAYERALALAPRFADARFNLASLYEEQGETALATQHLRAYKDLTERG